MGNLDVMPSVCESVRIAEPFVPDGLTSARIRGSLPPLHPWVRVCLPAAILSCWHEDTANTHLDAMIGALGDDGNGFVVYNVETPKAPVTPAWLFDCANALAYQLRPQWRPGINRGWTYLECDNMTKSMRILSAHQEGRVLPTDDASVAECVRLGGMPMNVWGDAPKHDERIARFLWLFEGHQDQD